MTEQDIETAKAQQLGILQGHVDMLSPGDRALYSRIKEGIEQVIEISPAIGYLALAVVCTEAQGEPLKVEAGA